MLEGSTKDLDAPYWAALADGRLEMPRCGGCGRWHWPALARCGECGHWGMSWHDVPLEGTVFSWTRTWHDFGGTEHLEKPFITAVIAITGAEDRRLMGLLEGVAPDREVPIGARVTGRVTKTRYADQDIPAISWQLAD